MTTHAHVFKALRHLTMTFLLAIPIAPLIAQLPSEPLPTVPKQTIPPRGTNTTSYQRCATDYYDSLRRAQNPAYDQLRAQFEQAFLQWLQQSQIQLQAGQVYTIPVVVHVVYANSAQNPTNAQIQALINALNLDFRRQNPDTANTPAVWKPIAADIEIQFCLAQVDPQGNPTNGIERRYNPNISCFTTNDDIKFWNQGGLDAWNPTQYFNIWIGNLCGGLLGYAEFPSGNQITSSHVTYGAVIDYCTVTGSCPSFGSRTLTHEVGHCLSLRHIWGDDGTACYGTDYCQDTPNQAGPTSGCPSFPQTDACSPSPPGIMFMNYMDYTDDACMNMFTQCQKTRMRNVLLNWLTPLLSSNACNPQGAPPTADFYGTPTTIYAGQSVNFYDQSLPAATSWNWSFPGGTPATSSVQNPQGIVYNNPGTYDVTLIACNNNGCDTLTKTNYIHVLPRPSCIAVANVDSTDTPAIYVYSGGYVSGHNNFSDIGKMEYFAPTLYSGFPYLTGVIFWFGVGKDGGSGNPVYVRIWDTFGNVLQTEIITYAQIQQAVDSGWLLLVPLDTPIQLPTNHGIFAGVEFSYAPGDTLAIVTNRDGNSIPATAWEIWQDGSWYAYDDPNSWGLRVSHYIWLVLTDTLPQAQFTPNPASACVGEPILLDASPSQGASAYEWYLPGGTPPYDTLQQVQVAYSTPGTYDVTLIVHSECLASDTLYAPGAITIYPKPQITISPTAPIICQGQSVTLTASGAQSYFWAPATGLNTTTGPQVIASPSQTTTYTVTGTDANGCSNTATVTVTVTSQPPTASFTIQASDTPLCPGDTLYLNATAQNADSILWLLPGAIPSTASTPQVSITYTQPGTYTITLLAANGCGTDTAQASITIRNCATALPITTTDQILTIYLTPSGEILLTTSQPLPNTTIQIHNLTGQTLYQSTTTLPAGTQTIYQLPQPGIYWITIHTQHNPNLPPLHIPLLYIQ